MKDIYLVGASTTAIRVIELIRHHNLFRIKGLIVDDEYKQDETFYELPLLGVSEFKKKANCFDVALFICIGWNRLNSDRKKVFNTFKEFNLVNIISPTAIIRGDILGRNVYVGDNCIVEAKSKIFDNVYIDHCAFIGYNVAILNNVFLALRSTLAGSVKIGEQSFIGMGALIFDKTIVGNKCIISGGEIVKRNIADNSIVRSKNGEQIIKSYTEEEIIYKLIASKNVR